MNKKTSSSNNTAKMNSLSGQRTWHGIGTRTALAALLGMGLVAQETRGETVLFSDTFNVTENSNDVNYQNTNGRQSGGSLDVIPYTVVAAANHAQVGHPEGPNALMFFAKGGSSDLNNPRLSLDHDFIEYPASTSHGFISFNVDPVCGGTNIPSHWVGLTLGTSSNSRNVDINNSDGFGILFRGNGNFVAFNGAAQIGSEGTYTTTTNGFHAVNIIITGPVDGNPWDGTNGTMIAVFADGKDSPFFRYTKPGIGYTTNYITLMGYGSDSTYTYHAIDNLQIGYVAAVATNLSLKVDFQHTATASAPETQVGFFDFNEQDAGSATYPTAAGPVTVALSGLDILLGGFYNRGGVANNGSLTYAGVYKDFAFKNGASPQSLTLTLSGPGILPRERYRLTFYSYDDDAAGSSHSVSFAGGSGTTGAAGPLAYTCGQDPSSNSAYAVTGFFKSDASGQISVVATDTFISSSTTGIRLNAFEIVPDFLQKGTMVSFF